ncbi:MAG: type VI secretion system baseplate subunit TssE [Gemmatimonadaceae bacterium]|jgi:type VI secretion system protein ImpF|nr:type VI secretion system baseplate subunit TssE [Gemmatimonadaceae bacterium]
MSEPARALPLPSVFDRLRQEARSVTTPRRELVPRFEQARAMEQYRAQVVRDVQWLLNTRRVHALDAVAYPEVHASAFCFGLPDFTALPADGIDTPMQLARWIEKALTLFEPRLSQVRVRPIAREETIPRRFRFGVSAMLRVEDWTVPVAFDTSLVPGDQQWQVTEVAAHA